MFIRLQLYGYTDNHGTIYLNSDHIIAVSPKPDHYEVLCTNKEQFALTEKAGDYLLQFVDANDALITDTEASSAPILQTSLESKIAQLLRDAITNITAEQIAQVLGGSLTDIHLALGRLREEHIIFANGDYYYHANQRNAHQVANEQACTECKGTGKVAFNSNNGTVVTPCYHCEGTGQTTRFDETVASSIVTEALPE